MNAGKKAVQMHRLILGLSANDRRQGDHINGDGLDNRRSNLRLASNTENSRNSRKTKSTTSSAYKGVCWARREKKWLASITVDRKHKYLGRFDSEIEAALAYDEAAKKYFGEFACLNFPAASAT